MEHSEPRPSSSKYTMLMLAMTGDTREFQQRDNFVFGYEASIFQIMFSSCLVYMFFKFPVYDLLKVLEYW